jgi:hypothetical protein
MEQPTISTTDADPQISRRKNGNIWWGVVLIVGGIIILTQHLGLLGPRYNWWALFILVPAFATLSGAFYTVQAHGRLTNGALSTIGSSLIIFTVAFMFLFGLDWTRWWPLMVVVPGFSLLLGGIDLGAGSKKGSAWLNMAFWLGLGVMYVGAGFLVKNLGIFSPQAYFEPYRWWAAAIFIPAVGALINALVIGIRSQRMSGAVLALLFFGLIAGATGVVAFLGLDWNLLGPILLILAGATILLGIFRRK